jgi:hypothetical protein
LLICLGCVQGWRRKRGSGLVVRAEMFGQLTTGLESAWNKLRGTDQLTKDNIAEPMRDIRRALLEADVCGVILYMVLLHFLDLIHYLLCR